MPVHNIYLIILLNLQKIFSIILDTTKSGLNLQGHVYLYDAYLNSIHQILVVWTITCNGVAGG